MLTQQMSRIKTVYQNQLWGPGDNLDGMPNPAMLNFQIQDLLNISWNKPVILDIEHWPLYTSARHRDQLLQVMAAFKSANPAWEIGNYAVAPKRNYVEAMFDEDSAKYWDWRRENDVVKEIAQASDILCPSLYTLTPDPQWWGLFAVANIKEAQRIGPGKKIIPYLWPQYHTTLASHSLKYIDGEFWHTQLMLVWRMCQGAIIWKISSPPEAFSWSHQWATATEQFMDYYLYGA